MKNSSVGLLQICMWIVCIFHVSVGLALNLDIGLKEWVGSGIYGARVDWSDAQFVYILKPLGAFMIALGIMAGIAARDPLGKRAIVYGFVVLFCLRALQRIVFMGDTQATFAIPPARSLTTMVVMFAIAALLVILTRAAGAAPAGRLETARP
jgi:hypothetical protein